MSIISSLVKSVQSGTPLLKALETAADQIVTWGTNLVAKAEANPSYGAAVTAAVNDTKAAVAGLEDWVGTALDTDLSNFGDELAALVVKYAPTILGGASPETAAATTLLGALTSVGTAVINHEVLALQGSAVTPPPANG